MTDDPELTVTPPTREPPARSAAAERMRLHRERRRKGLRCLTVEVRDTEIDALVRTGLLSAKMRNDQNSIIKSLYTFLDHTLR